MTQEPIDEQKLKAFVESVTEHVGKVEEGLLAEGCKEVEAATGTILFTMCGLMYGMLEANKALAAKVVELEQKMEQKADKRQKRVETSK